MSKKQKISESDGKKVNKYLCAFNNKWLNEENCKQWLKKVDEKTANCILCNSNFTIIYDGFLAIEKHMRNASHVKNSKLILRQNTINNFFVKKVLTLSIAAKIYGKFIILKTVITFILLIKPSIFLLD
jgi:hypothetical protein